MIKTNNLHTRANNITLKVFRGLPVAPLAVKSDTLGFPHGYACVISYSIVRLLSIPQVQLVEKAAA